MHGLNFPKHLASDYYRLHGYVPVNLNRWVVKIFPDLDAGQPVRNFKRKQKYQVQFQSKRSLLPYLYKPNFCKTIRPTTLPCALPLFMAFM